MIGGICLSKIQLSSVVRVLDVKSEVAQEDAIDILVSQYSKELTQELIMGTLPGYSNRMVQRRIGIRDYYKLPSWANFEFSKFYDFYLKYFNQLPFGGFLLMEHNFARYSSKESQEKYLKTLSERYTKKIIIKNKNWKYYYFVEIKPFLISDCVPWGANEPYCRIMELETSIKSGEITYSVISKYFQDIGLNSPIGPILDNENNAASISNDEINKIDKRYKKEFKEIIKFDQIPILKHFGYSYSIGDTHHIQIKDNASKDQIRRNIFHFYEEIDKLQIPYMVMTGHHYLTSLDEKNPISMSNIVKEYIRKNLKNAIIISDELSMINQYGDNKFEDLIVNSVADIRMVHSGLTYDLISKRNSIYAAARKIDSENLKISLRKVLEIKKHYGLLSIKKIKIDEKQIIKH